MAGGVAQGEGPEFKSQYQKNPKACVGVRFGPLYFLFLII
jgi:hypothetical protein